MFSPEERLNYWNTDFNTRITETVERSGVALKDWRVGGRASKANPNREDYHFWMKEGPRQVEGYVKWMETSGWQFATMPDGKPGIEWEAEVWFGGRPVRMVVDAIYQVGDDWVVVDYKTGSRTPMWEMQTSLYASALERVYGKRPTWGAFFMTRKSALSDLMPLDRWGPDYFDMVFSDMNAKIDMGLLAPNVGDHCASFCGVSEFCQAINPQSPKAKPYPFVTKKEN